MIVTLFDTETTGLMDNHTVPLEKLPSIIEWYSCTADLSTGEVLSELELLIKPPRGISQEIVNITGIDDAMVAAAPSFAFVAGDVKKVIESANRMLAHNASYDVEVTDTEFERLGQKVKWPRVLCTVEATVHLKGFRLNLTGLHEMLFGETFKGAHRAKADVMAHLRCCCELYRLGEI